jgi:hypothetical protein
MLVPAREEIVLSAATAAMPVMNLEAGLYALAVALVLIAGAYLLGKRGRKKEPEGK